LTGDFTDCDTKFDFEYFPPTIITKIVPPYGPKDGDTPVKVYGKHFKDFGDENTLCGFGTRTTKATVFNDTYIECKSPPSDVVAKPIPFTISLNKQQNSRDTLFFWYYNFPEIERLVPDRGPEDGGTNIILYGREFFPFKDYLDTINNAPDVWCAFPDLKKRTHAIALNSTFASCVSPPADQHTHTRVEITLNGVEYTDDQNIFYYYKPPNLFDLNPRMGPVRGNTTVLVVGSNFEDTGEIRCDFEFGEVAGKFVSNSEIVCISP
jgi:IPT/TIG domain